MSHSHHLFVLGQSGLLGGCLCERARLDPQSAHFTLTTPDARTFVDKLLARNQDAVTKQVADEQDGQQDWIYACGEIDPSADLDRLRMVNAEAPRHLFQMLSHAVEKLALPPGRVRLVTFGSVLEERPAIIAVNPYISSKALLFESHVHRAGLGAPLVDWIHIRLHTLYGKRPPPPFMFLGQMAAALKARSVFSMSAGNQLREYHHADDVADNVLNVLRSPDPANLITLTNGKSIMLGDLATTVFEYFRLRQLLRIGVVAAQPGEVFAADTERCREVVADRDAIQGITSWFEGLGIERAQVCAD